MLDKIIPVLLVMIVSVFILTVSFDFYHYDKVWSASSPEALKNACLVDWYKNGTLDGMPAQCRQFYSQGISVTR